MSEVTVSKPVARENPLFSIIFGVALPFFVLNKFSDGASLGPKRALVLALAIPMIYGLVDYLRRRQHNLLAAIGLLGTAVTGGLGLMQVDGFWFAVKEAAVPSLLGVIVLTTSFLGKPIISKVLLNEQMLDVEKLQLAIKECNVETPFQQLLRRSNVLLAVSFFLSAVLNFVLARVMLKSPAGTPEFNSELASMNAWSFVVIALPSIAFIIVAMIYFFRGLKALTGLESKDVMRA